MHVCMYVYMYGMCTCMYCLFELATYSCKVSCNGYNNTPSHMITVWYTYMCMYAAFIGSVQCRCMYLAIYVVIWWVLIAAMLNLS